MNDTKTGGPAFPADPHAMAGMKHSHYFKDVSNLTHIDVYRVLQLFGVTDPCLQHAAKKLLVAGGRGAKDIEQDVQEAIDTLTRWKGMRIEEKTQQRADTQATDPCSDDGEDWQINHGFAAGVPPTLDPHDFVMVEFRHGRLSGGLAKWFAWYHLPKYPSLDIMRYKKVPE